MCTECISQLGSSVLEYETCYIQGQYRNRGPWVADKEGNFEDIKSDPGDLRGSLRTSMCQYLHLGQRGKRLTCLFLVTIPCSLSRAFHKYPYFRSTLLLAIQAIKFTCP